MNIHSVFLLSVGLLDGISGGDRSQVLVLLGALVALVVAIGIVHWSRVRRAEIEADLKRDLLDRGMSIDEIERVMRLGNSSQPYKYK